MSVESLLILLLFSIICGIVGQAIGGHKQQGSLPAILAVGFIVAFFGTWMAAFLGLPSLIVVKIGVFSFSIVWSLLGSAMLMSVISLFHYRRYYVY